MIPRRGLLAGDGDLILALPQPVYDDLRGDVEADRSARSYEATRDAQGRLQAVALFNIKGDV